MEGIEVPRARSLYILSMKVYHKLSCLSLRATWIILLGLRKVERGSSLNQVSYRV